MSRKFWGAAAASFALCAGALPLAGQMGVSSESMAKARAPAQLTLTDAVTLVTRRYPGHVISAQVDPVQGDSRHFHVDILLPNDKTLPLEIDGATSAIRNRIPPVPGPDSYALVDALKFVQSRSVGRVASIEYDHEPQPHYHVNLLRTDGETVRLDLDLATYRLTRHISRT